MKKKVMKLKPEKTKNSLDAWQQKYDQGGGGWLLPKKKITIKEGSKISCSDIILIIIQAHISSKCVTHTFAFNFKHNYCY